MNITDPFVCPLCGSGNNKLIFYYTKPPIGETTFQTIGNKYKRKIVQCELCSHMVSIENLLSNDMYISEYNKSTYTAPDGMRKTFTKIINLDNTQSDNYGRCNRIETFINESIKISKKDNLKLLDVGSGLGIFPHEMKKRGYNISALDTDADSIAHIASLVGVPTLCGEFGDINVENKFDFIFFNKVLEHVHDPVQMLSKAVELLNDGGYVYFEVPDGEIARKSVQDREEFYIEHHHIFSFTSSSLLSTNAGLSPVAVERVIEPSSKYTLRVFCRSINKETNE